MLNALFILVVFLLQMKKEDLHVEWPLNGKANITFLPEFDEIRIEMEYLQLEPINLVLVFFFTLILIVQFVGMVRLLFLINFFLGFFYFFTSFVSSF